MAATGIKENIIIELEYDLFSITDKAPRRIKNK